ncbi:MAG: hypothetical protein H6739_21685 [Alphaproteobacteria bacterium]|nr:hypothetical protein [Alphaproteobacteria bacterium]
MTDPLLPVLDARLASCRPALIVAPPRSASTAFSRALGQHSAFRRQIHEPCEVWSYQRGSLQVILDALADLDAHTLIKEMTFQIREPALARSFLRNSRAPVLFLVRSPLRTIESRLRMVLTDLKAEPTTSEADRARIEQAIAARDHRGVADLLTEEVFPLWRTGWADLGDQLALCRAEGIDHLIVEAGRFRADPEATLRAVCARLGLPFEPQMLQWQRHDRTPHGAWDAHARWYARVNQSTGVLPPDTEDIQEERFPPRFRAHVPEAMAVYREALSSPSCI